MLVETLLLVIVNIVIVLVLLKLLQTVVTHIAKTSKDRFHNIYQGGELLGAKNRRYYSNLYILILLFLILHIIVFLISTLALVNITSDVAIVMIGFLLAFLYTVLIIRKGVNYS